MISKENQKILQEHLTTLLDTSDSAVFTSFCNALLRCTYPEYQTLFPVDEAGTFSSPSEDSDLSAASSAGFLPSTSTYFQIYGPVAEDSDATVDLSAERICSDFEKLYAQSLKTLPIREYKILVSSRANRTAKLSMEDFRSLFAELPQFSEIRFDLLSARKLERYFWSRDLSDSQRIHLLENPELLPETEGIASDSSEPPASSQTKKEGTTITTQEGSALPPLGQFCVPESRELECAEIDELLHEENHLYLTGPSGIGVRTTALLYAHKKQREGQNVHWLSYDSCLPVDSDGLVRAMVHTLAAYLPDDPNPKNQGISELFARLEEEWKDQLLILDGFDSSSAAFSKRCEEDGFQRFLALPAKILIVTHEVIPQEEHTLSIGPLPMEEQLSLLSQVLGRPVTGTKVLDQVKGHTLTLCLLGKVLSDTSLGLDDFLKAATKQKRKKQADSLFACLSVLLQLCHLSDVETDLLVQALLLPSDGLSWDFFRDCQTASGIRAAEKLLARGWLQLDAENKLSMHALYKEFVSATLLTSGGSNSFLSPLIHTVKKISPPLSGGKLLPHEASCQAFLNRAYDSYLESLNMGKPVTATYDQMAQLFAAFSSYFPTEHVPAFSSYGAWFQTLTGHYDKAALLQEQSFKGGTLSEIAEKSPDALLFLASCQLLSGQIDHCLTSLDAFLAPSDLDVSLYQRWLQLSILASAITKEPEIMLESALQAGNLALDPQMSLDTPKTIWLLAYGNALRLNQKEEEADQIYRKACSMMDIFPEHDNENFLQELFYRSRTGYSGLGDSKMQELTLSLLFQTQKDLADTMKLECSLLLAHQGLLALERENLCTAQEAFAEAIKILHLNQWISHPYCQNLMADLGWIYEHNGKPAEALAFFEELELLGSASGGPVTRYHRKLLFYVYYHLGLLYRECGQPDRALDKLKAYEALLTESLLSTDAESEYADLVPDSTPIWYLLGTIYYELGHYDSAIRYLRMVSKTENSFVCYYLGLSLLETGQYHQAELTLSEGLEQLKEWADQGKISPDHGDFGWYYSALGHAISLTGKNPEEILAYCETAKQILTKQYPSDHLTIANICWRTGLADSACGKDDQARREYDQVLEILETDARYKIKYSDWIRQVREARVQSFQLASTKQKQA